MKKGTEFFENLDALRFLAFLGVFILHTLPLPTGPASTASVFDFIGSAFSLEYLGVPFFFTLSSFLITYKLLAGHKETDGIRLGRFYLKRGLRIWPIYFLLLVICFAGLPVVSSILNVEQPTLPSLMPFLLFYSNFYMIDHGVGFIFALIPLWSIAIEEQFYIVWGLVMKYIKKYLSYFITLILIISITFSYYYLYSLNRDTMDLKLHSLFAVPDFCLGAIVAIIAHERKKIFNQLLALPRIFYGGIYFLLVAVYVLQNFQVIHFDPVIINLFNAFCYAIILFHQSFYIRRIFNAGGIKIINYLGRISYGLYIYHELVVSLLLKADLFKSNQSLAATILHSAIALIATIIISSLSFQLIEKFFLKMKDRI